MHPTIRVAQDEDLPALTRWLGQQFYFTERLRRQHHDRGRLFVALLANRPAGDIYVSLEKADEPELRLYLPAVPLLQHLEVRDGARNRGIGTRLISAAETFLRQHDHGQVALGVAMDNHDAIRLYQQLGYQEWTLSPVSTFREVFADDGTVSHEPEQCRVLVKSLVD